MTRNGAPAANWNIWLQPLDDQAAATGGVRPRTSCDASGTFTLREVPTGDYTPIVRSPSRQEFRGETLTIGADSSASVRIDLRCGGIRGRVATPDDAPPAELRGYAWILPGAAVAPDDIDEYRRQSRCHAVAVRNGNFEDPDLTPGPALLLLDLRGRTRTSIPIVVPEQDMLTLEVPAGARLQ